jgi:hypothetical protein
LTTGIFSGTAEAEGTADGGDADSLPDDQKVSGTLTSGTVNNPVTFTNPAILALFTGAGNIVLNGFTYTATAGSFSGGNALITQVTNANLDISVVYNYDAATSLGDPQFSGFQGQNFQVHGFPDAYFNLISTPKFQMNGRFAYIAAGSCTYNHTQCWTHPGTYIDDLGIRIEGHLIRIKSGSHRNGLTAMIDGVVLSNNATRQQLSAHTRVHAKNPNTFILQTELFTIEVVNSDNFFNIMTVIVDRHVLEAGQSKKPVLLKASQSTQHDASSPFPDLPIHGFIGQTWKNAVYPAGRPFAGEVADYEVKGAYAIDSVFNYYKPNPATGK